ncbi:MAG: hypothetical protein HYZ30_00555 [Candidatus Azosocius agrarius]|nr:MAG: hypothetical protein HYZ30_00555 [Gammaproteobacteria bacterium]
MFYTKKINFFESFFILLLFFFILFIDGWLIWKFTAPLMVPLYHVINVLPYDMTLDNLLNYNYDITIYNCF